MLLPDGCDWRKGRLRSKNARTRQLFVFSKLSCEVDTSQDHHWRVRNQKDYGMERACEFTVLERQWSARLRGWPSG